MPLTQAQRDLVATRAAQNNVAGTANTNPADDTSRSSQTADNSAPSTPISTTESQNLKTAATANYPGGTTNPIVGGQNALAAATGNRGRGAQPLQQPSTDEPQKQKQNAVTAIGNSQAKTYQPTTNPLDAYASYTYGITLHVLTKEDYNTMVKSPKSFTPTKTLISSAGRYSEMSQVPTGPRSWKNVGRDPAFQDDFYFDNLKVETVIGLNASARGSNAITVDFTIIEPYGMTLLDRLMDVNNTGLNGKNYLEMPYLLEISFFGADDTGALKKIQNQTKWLPIKIVDMKIKANVKGAEYQISAVPFNHAAHLESVQAIKTRMEITGSTVGEYFSNATDAATDKAAAAVFDADAKRQQQQNQIQTGPVTNKDVNSAASTTGNRGRGAKPLTTNDVRQTNLQSLQATQEPITLNAKSFVAAYNAWYKEQYKNGNINYADQIRVEFVESSTKEISNSLIVDVKKNSVRRAGETDAKTAAKGNSGKDATSSSFQSIIHSLEAGTTVNGVISTVIPQSKYFLDQVIDGSTQNKSADAKSNDSAITNQQAKTVKAWKIVPSVELKDFDASRNVWGKTVTFYVNSYNAYQNHDDRLPKSLPPTPVKLYEYIYTGHNSSVINFDIDFNCLYFTAINVDRGKGSAATGASQKPEDQQLKDKKENNTDKNNIQPNKFDVVADNQATSKGGASSRSETINSLSALQSLYSTAGGDMISVKLQILGDPEFIKQDDLFITPGYLASLGPSTNTSQYVPGTQSLDMDSGEVYCYLKFKTPKDFDDSTGMYDLKSSNKYAVSEFSGYYKIITVTNEFRNGKFTQNLELIRYKSQPSVNKSKASDDTSTTQGDNERKQTTKQIQKDNKNSNPLVSSKNVDKKPDPQNTAQSIPAKIAASGPDLDAVNNVQSSLVKNAVVHSDAEPTTADVKLSQVATTGATYDVASLASNPPLAESNFLT